MIRYVLFIAAIAFGCPAGAESELRIGFPSVGTLISGQVGTVLQNTEILKKHGFAAKVQPLALGKELKAALVAGQLDVILTSEANFLVLIGQGFDCKAIASLGSGGKMALVVKADSALSSVASLKGKKIGTLFGTSLHRPAVQWTEQAGLRAPDVTLANIPDIGAMRAGLFAGELDAIVDLDPHLYENTRNGRLRRLKEDSIELVAVASSEFLKKHPEALARLRAALREAAFYLATHKSEVNGWYAKLNGYDPAMIDASSKANANYAAKSLAAVDVSVSRELRAKLRHLAEFLHAQKLIKAKPNLEQAIP